MENKTELQLLRPRSLAAVISDGYRLYMGTFRTLFRSSWPVAIAYAVAFALLMGNVVNNVIPLQVSLQGTGASMPPSALGYYLFTLFLFALVAILLAAQDVHIFREHAATDDVTRPQHWWGRLCLKPFLRLLIVEAWMVLVAIVLEFVLVGVGVAVMAFSVTGDGGAEPLSPRMSIAAIVLFSVLILIISAFCVPFCYTVMRALLHDVLPADAVAKGKKVSMLAPPFRGYALGLRHWGLLFATILVVCLFTGLLTLVCELPAVIMAGANTLAYVGLAQGDPLGMPENMVPLTYAVFLVAGFIQAYVHLSTLFPFYYAYGSIEQQERERKTMFANNSH